MGPHLQPELNQRSLQRNLISIGELSMHQRDAWMLMTCLLCMRTYAPIYVRLIKWEIKEQTTISLGLERLGNFSAVL